MSIEAPGMRRNGSLYLVLEVLGGLLLLFIIAPLIGLFFMTPLSDVGDTIANRDVRASVWLTLWTSMMATLVVAVGAIPLGYVLARRDFPLKGLLSAVLDIPIVIPHSAAGIALLGILSKDAFIGRAADAVGIQFVGNTLGIMVAMAFVSVPFLINSCREGFAQVPRRLEGAALNLGASPARVFFTISIPLARRSILTGLVLMWGRGMSEFGAVMIMAYRPMVTPILIWEWYTAYGLSYARPLALIFIVICLGVFILLRMIAGRDYHVKG